MLGSKSHTDINNSLIYSCSVHHLFLVTVSVDPEPILETLGVRQEYTWILNGTSIHHRAPGTHIMGQFTVASPPTGTFLGAGRNPDKIHMDKGRTCERPHRMDWTGGPGAVRQQQYLLHQNFTQFDLLDFNITKHKQTNIKQKLCSIAISTNSKQYHNKYLECILITYRGKPKSGRKAWHHGVTTGRLYFIK